MSFVINNFNKVKAVVGNNANIIAVSKSFEYKHIEPLVIAGHKHFGENKVQEAKLKWLSVKNKVPNINLHMIGKLQSNKAKEAVELFDYIHSLDNLKLANLLSKFETVLSKKRKYFIQVNLGRETQKNGILIENVNSFYKQCSEELKLNVIGLMTIPPNDNNSSQHFRNLLKLNESLGLRELSMGMTADYFEALKNKSTFIRIGSAIFGSRN